MIAAFFLISLGLMYFNSEQDLNILFITSMFIFAIYGSLLGIDSIPEIPAKFMSDASLVRMIWWKILFAFLQFIPLIWFFGHFAYSIKVMQEYSPQIQYIFSLTYVFWVGFFTSLLVRIAIRKLILAFLAAQLILMSPWLRIWLAYYGHSGYIDSNLVGVYYFLVAIVILPVALYQITPYFLRAMIWKEFREIRWFWLGAIITLFVLTYPLQSTGEVLMEAGVFLSLVYAGFIGSRAFAGEKEKGFYDYIISRPIPPRSFLWVKYIFGIVQLLSLLILLTILTASWNQPIYLVDQFTQAFSTPVVIFTFLMGFYSICFLASIYFRDTIRALLVGFVSAIGFGLLITILNQGSHPSLLMDERAVLYIKDTLDFLVIHLFVIGLIGISFYSLYRKRVVWKTGFTSFIPMGIGLMVYSHFLYYGNLQPIGINNEVNFNNGNEYGLNTLYYSQGKVYGFQILPKVNIPELTSIDIAHPDHPVVSQRTKLPYVSYHARFDDNKLYVVEYHGPTNTMDLNNIYLSSYSLSPKISLVQSVPLFQGKEERPNVIYYPYIFPKGDYLYLVYGIDTSIPANGKSYSTAPLKQHVLKIDKQTLHLVEQFDAEGNYSIPNLFLSDKPQEFRLEFYSNSTSSGVRVFSTLNKETSIPDNTFQMYYNSPRNLESQRSDWVFSSRLKGKYLYTSTIKHILEIYDVTRKDKPLLGTVDRNFMDQTSITSMNNSIYFDNAIQFHNNRAIIQSNRGFYIVDISNLEHPKLLKRMTSDHVQLMALHDDYLYTTGVAYPFAVYKLP